MWRKAKLKFVYPLEFANLAHKNKGVTLHIQKIIVPLFNLNFKSFMAHRQKQEIRMHNVDQLEFCLVLFLIGFCKICYVGERELSKDNYGTEHDLKRWTFPLFSQHA